MLLFNDEEGNFFVPRIKKVVLNETCNEGLFVDLELYDEQGMYHDDIQCVLTNEAVEHLKDIIEIKKQCD